MFEYYDRPIFKATLFAALLLFTVQGLLAVYPFSPLDWILVMTLGIFVVNECYRLKICAFEFFGDVLAAFYIVIGVQYFLKLPLMWLFSWFSLWPLLQAFLITWIAYAMNITFWLCFLRAQKKGESLVESLKGFWYGS